MIPYPNNPGDGHEPVPKKDECPFCPMFIGRPNERVIAIEPLNPVVLGHILVIPLEHVLE